jgi:predicted short-subunit dehydrogenase-like oxidoreductase (DUF2520 family)
MNIVFVGAGRLATNLAKSLKGAGHQIVAVYSRTMTSAATLCDKVGGIPTDDIEALPLEADAFILSVKDSALPSVITLLQKDREKQAFLHTTGSIPMTVFGAHQHCGVLYPMQTFSKEKQVDFTRVHFFIEGSDEQALNMARSIALSVTDHVHELSSDERRYLHLSAVFACNFANHCYALSAKIMEAHGMSFDAMLPLIKETTEKVGMMHPRDAQTGPAIRWDENVMAAQKALLTDEPDMQQIYELMSKSIHTLAND